MPKTGADLRGCSVAGDGELKMARRDGTRLEALMAGAGGGCG